MCFEKTPPFIRMIFGALGGALLGIVFGLFFGLIIAWASNDIVGGNMSDDFKEIYHVGSFLGMGAGAIIGSILGAVYSNKK